MAFRGRLLRRDSARSVRITMIDITIESLLSVAGNAALVAIILQLLVKPSLVKLKDSRPDLYPVILNVLAVAVGVAFAFLAQLAFNLDYASALQAVLTGLVGAAVATLGYETVTNFTGLVKK